MYINKVKILISKLLLKIIKVSSKTTFT